MTDPAPAPDSAENAAALVGGSDAATGDEAPGASTPGASKVGEASGTSTSGWGIPGGRVVTVATLVVVGVAVAEVQVEDRIGLWTGIALIAVSVIAPLVTRHGDRSLPAMMPPLAFLAAVLVAGQPLVEPDGGSWRTRQAVMIAENLGANAPWVTAATAVSVTIATIGHLVDRRRRRRAA